MKRSLALAAFAALAFTSAAWAHARVSPPVALANQLQEFTLAVPTEKANARTTSVALTLPKGFAIDSFFPSPGWTRSEAHGVVTWSGGSVPTDEDAVFSFLASTSGTGPYVFGAKQTYSDGSVVDWSGPESSDSPAPTLRAVSSFGGGTSALVYVALALGGVAVLLGGIALLLRTGRELG
jgi:uncharacterized protein YcnI